MFGNRTEAGQQLADEVAAALAEDPAAPPSVVLALPRGGVPVAFQIARRLDAPLGLVLVRKIGAPGQPELAAAALVDGAEPQLVRNRDVMAATGMTEAMLDEARQAALAEIARRRARYFADRPRPAIEGRTVVLVDDGIATGATVRAALKGLRLQRPATLVLAVPVAAADSLERLRGAVDRIVCLKVPGWFRAVGMHYADFGQTPDDEVIRLLDAAAGFGTAGGEAASPPQD